MISIFAAGTGYTSPAALPDAVRWALAALVILVPLFIIIYDRIAKSRQRRESSSVLDDFSIAGFAYDSEQNIFYSRRDAWQRDFGYSRLYDDLAADMNMIFQAEPICFSYDGRDWMIEFWKGQYGLTTGGEIGIYVAGEDGLFPDDRCRLFYRTAEGNEMLRMKYELEKNDRPLFNLGGRHWWLAGFRPGEFSEPSELVMRAEVEFRSEEMLEAFLRGARRLGYARRDFDIKRDRLRFVFKKPRSRQPESQTGKKARRVQKNNKKLCEQYNRLTEKITGDLEKLEFYRRRSPIRYNRLLRLGGALSRKTRPGIGPNRGGGREHD